MKVVPGDILSEVLCNLCGESCGLCDGPMPDPDRPTETFGGLIDAKVVGGYHSTPGNGSGALDDLTSYEFDLCEYCLDWMFSKCRIPPTVVCLVGNPGPETFRPAEYRAVGRKHKKFFLAEKDRRDVNRGIE